MEPTKTAMSNRGRSVDPYHIQVLDRAVRLMDAIIANNGPISIHTLETRLGLHQSTTYRIVRALVDLGLLEIDSTGRVIPGLKLGLWSQSGNQSDALLAKVSPDLHRLAESTKEVVNLGLLHQHKVLYVKKFEAPESEPGLTVRVGQSAPLYCSALGKILLAGMSERERQTAMEAQTFHRLTSRTITDANVLESEIVQVQQRGWAEDREEFVAGIVCFGAPVVWEGKTVAAISITMPVIRSSPQQEQRLRELLVGTAQDISRTVSHTQASVPMAPER